VTGGGRTGGAGRAAALLAGSGHAAAWLLVTVLALAGAILTGIVWGELAASDTVANLGGTFAAVWYATLGALVVRRTGNRIGWLLLGHGAGLAIMSLASGYAVEGIIHPGTFPAPDVIGLLAEWFFVPVVVVFGFIMLLFPSGTLPSRRWRPFAWLVFLAAGLALIGFAVRPRLVALPPPGGVSLMIPNPWGVRSLGPVLSHLFIGTLKGLVGLLLLPLLAASLVSLVIRYRAGGREARQQIKWFALAGVAALASQFAGLLATTANHGASSWLLTASYVVMAVLVLFGFPAAITVAILRHGLYQIDVIINRALVYGLLSAAVTATYAGIVVGIGTIVGDRGGPVLTVAAAVAIAVLFQPARHRAQVLANRIVYGQRATPYQVLADFAQDMAGLLDFDVALDRMAAVLARAVGATRVEVWTRVGSQLRPRAMWPTGSPGPAAIPLADSARLPVFDATRAAAVRHRNELLGALTVHKPRNEPILAAEDKLLQHLASQAGLVLRNVRLTDELKGTIDDLRASRLRLVRAQDDERQRLERNLHDGAQQQLIALGIQLSLLEDATGDPGEVKDITRQLRSALHAALEDLRALARGIYPPLLADQGLTAALRAQATKLPLAVSIETDGIGRYPRDAEAAVYFCTLEALQNVAKYAHASQVTITVSCPEGHLTVTITDDGTGFDTATATHGTGLQGMGDRLAALGGTLQIHSKPGLGTTVTGSLPVSELTQVRAGGDARPCRTTLGAEVTVHDTCG
jgi:signal transduction histidine kinase